MRRWVLYTFEDGAPLNRAGSISYFVRFLSTALNSKLIFASIEQILKVMTSFYAFCYLRYFKIYALLVVFGSKEHTNCN